MNKELDRLELVADTFFISLPNITRLLGKKPSLFAGYNKREGIGRKLTLDLKEKLGINPMFLKFGEGDMLLSEKFIVEKKDLNNEGYRLKKWLKDNKITQSQLGEKIDESNQSISNWIKNEKIPESKFEKLKKIDIDIDWLKNGDKQEEPQIVNEDNSPVADIQLISYAFYKRDFLNLTDFEKHELTRRMKESINAVELLLERKSIKKDDFNLIQADESKVKVRSLQSINKKEQ